MGILQKSEFWVKERRCLYLYIRWALIAVLRMTFIGARVVNEWGIASGLNQKGSNTWGFLVQFGNRGRKTSGRLDKSWERKVMDADDFPMCISTQDISLNLDSHFVLCVQEKNMTWKMKMTMDKSAKVKKHFWKYQTLLVQFVEERRKKWKLYSLLFEYFKVFIALSKWRIEYC